MDGVVLYGIPLSTYSGIFMVVLVPIVTGRFTAFLMTAKVLWCRASSFSLSVIARKVKYHGDVRSDLCSTFLHDIVEMFS